jgi:hypothetical protein
MTASVPGSRDPAPKPLIYKGGLTGRIFLTTDYKPEPDGKTIAVNTKLDITDALAAFLRLCPTLGADLDQLVAHGDDHA